MYRVLKPFEFFEPESLDETLQLLSECGTRCRPLAGGVDLVHKMRLRRILPQFVVSLQRIPGLNYAEVGVTGLRIGALATIRSLELSESVRNEYNVLWEAVRSIATVQIKTMGTAVGNICAATPASDVVPPLAVLGATLRIVSSGRGRVIPIEDFFLGPGWTVLEPSEIVVEVSVPKLGPKEGGAFFKIAKTNCDIAKVNVAAWVSISENRCVDVRIALGSVAPTVIRATKSEEMLQGEELEEKIFVAAAEVASEHARPITDIRSTLEYRKEMIKVLVRDALRKAAERANGR